MTDETIPAAMNSWARAVGESYLFKTLSGADKDMLLSVGREVEADEGEVILSQGERGDCFYLVLEGKVKVSTTKGTQAVPLAELGPGALLGEVAVLTGGERTATAVAVTKTRLVRFPSDSFLSVLDNNPKLKSLVQRVVARRAEDTIEKTLA